MMLTVPSVASLVMVVTAELAVPLKAAVISPSFAVRTFKPSGVKAMLSGREPTVAVPSSAPSAAFRKTTVPGFALSAAGKATATTPLWTATLVTSVTGRL